MDAYVFQTVSVFVTSVLLLLFLHPFPVVWHCRTCTLDRVIWGPRAPPSQRDQLFQVTGQKHNLPAGEPQISNLWATAGIPHGTLHACDYSMACGCSASGIY